MTKYQNQTLTGQAFQLEDCWFVNCVLKNCTLFFSGGSWELENTTFESCQWKFQNEAQRTCQLLGMIGLLPPMQMPLQMNPQPTGPVN
jgi:hypothetical protein